MNDAPLNEIKRSQKTVIFESDNKKKELVTRDKDNNITDAGKDQIAKHTLNVEFDFENVTKDEIVNFLVSTTSVMKMFQNNVTKHWDEKQILEHCAKGLYKCKVRELLDNRSSKILTDEEKRKRFIASQLKNGKTKEQVKAELLAMLSEIES